jgi:hypothetical protein
MRRSATSSPSVRKRPIFSSIHSPQVERAVFALTPGSKKIDLSMETKAHFPFCYDSVEIKQQQKLIEISIHFASQLFVISRGIQNISSCF